MHGPRTNRSRWQSRLLLGTLSQLLPESQELCFACWNCTQRETCGVNGRMANEWRTGARTGLRQVFPNMAVNDLRYRGRAPDAKTLGELAIAHSLGFETTHCFHLFGREFAAAIDWLQRLLDYIG